MRGRGQSAFLLILTGLPLIGFLLQLTLPALTHAQVPRPHITIDGGLEPLGGSGPRGFIEPNVTITEPMGVLRGGNLFHSFGRFNIPTDYSATFTGETPGIRNVIGRVTGGEFSDIDGILALDPLTLSGANLFLLNPAGVLFGPNAQLSIPGSFYVSTGDYLRLQDPLGILPNGMYSANPAVETVLTSAPPAAFGFLGSNPGAISAQGTLLFVPPGETFSLVGGDVRITNAFFEAPSGRIEIASVASPGEVLIAVENLNPSSFAELGKVEISQGSLIDTSGLLGILSGATSGGTIVIRGGQLVVGGGSEIANFAVGDAEAGLVNISATWISVNDGFIGIPPTNGILDSLSQQVFGLSVLDILSLFGGRGAEILIKGDSVTLNGGAGLDSSNFSAEQGNALTIISTDAITISGSGTRVRNNAFASGNAGTVSIAVPVLVIDDGAQLNSSTGARGRGGDIVIDVAGLTLDGGAGITSRTIGAGRSGNVTITAMESMAISGSAGISTSAGDSTAPNSLGTGDAGGISITAPTVTVNKAQISSNTYDQGLGGDIALDAGLLSLEGGGQISAFTLGAGNAGNVTITASEAVTMSSLPGGILTAAGDPGAPDPLSSAVPGRISITAPSLSLFDGAQINSSTATAGQGADVMLAVERLTIGNGGFIASATLSTGRGGNVTVPEGDTISIFGQGAGGFSQITTESQGPGQGGDINLRARSVELANRGKIEASSTGPANAGNIVINAGNQFLSTNGTVTTEASQASGGSFTLMAGDMVHLVNSKITTSVQGGTETRGGDITIDPQFVILQNSQIIAQAFQGQGGDITITAGTFLADPASLVSASSQLGVSGQVNIQSPVQNFSSSLAPLPKNFSSAAALLAQGCAARAPDGKFSTFVQAGREGVPVEPGGLLPSSLYAAEAEGMATAGELTQSAQEPPHPNPRSPEVNRGLPPGARVGPQVSAGRLGGEPVTLVAWEQGCAP